MTEQEKQIWKAAKQQAKTAGVANLGAEELAQLEWVGRQKADTKGTLDALFAGAEKARQADQAQMGRLLLQAPAAVALSATLQKQAMKKEAIFGLATPVKGMLAQDPSFQEQVVNRIARDEEIRRSKKNAARNPGDAEADRIARKLEAARARKAATPRNPPSPRKPPSPARPGLLRRAATAVKNAPRAAQIGAGVLGAGALVGGGALLARHMGKPKPPQAPIVVTPKNSTEKTAHVAPRTAEFFEKNAHLLQPQVPTAFRLFPELLTVSNG